MKSYNLCGFFQIKCCNKKGSLSFTTTNEALNIVLRHKTFFWGDCIFNYHKISITKLKIGTRLIENWYKTTFVWVVMSLGVKNKPLTYQCAIKKTFWKFFYDFFLDFLE